MTTITNDIIIKAAKAAGLNIYENPGPKGLAHFYIQCDLGHVLFDPRDDDTDNAMIMDGAEIDIVYMDGWLHASNIGAVADIEHEPKEKTQARRDAVILCAAAKWDAMNGGVK